VAQRNPESDNTFVYGVITTGIYCRPICSSRMPHREHVQFFDDWQMAEKAGFRPCKRCTPNASNAPHAAKDAVVQACKIIEEADREPSLKQLADAVGLSAYHFHRLFKKTVGITPKQYALEKRLNRVRKNLQKDSTVANAIYEAGYASSGRFYETAALSLGMKPAEYHKGGKNQNIRFAIVQSYLGWVLIAATERGICRIDFGDTPEILHMRLMTLFPKAILQENDSTFTTIIAQTIAFLEVPGQGLAIPLDVQGTAFQRRVWAALKTIPPGSTVNYAELAKRIGQPNASRAVAQACASNPVAVAVPCHRVVRSNGDLGGYRWGIERKQIILERESNIAALEKKPDKSSP
jgi:AraC family transcriptional regulator of adaptative response/methylated-DNA-[protein]-cysteine methyltransferase